MTLDAKQIGAAMRQARMLAGFSVRELADKSGMMESTIRSYEAGKTLPGLYNLMSIADALGLGLDELVGRKTEGIESRLRVLLYAMRSMAEQIALVTNTAIEEMGGDGQ